MPDSHNEPEQQSFSIVVVGNFNPAIFQPLWFSNNGLVPKEEAENANIIAIQKGLAAFELGTVQVQVDESRLMVASPRAPEGPIVRDIAMGTLNILEHTPLTAIGLNSDLHYSMGSEEAWHAVGHRIVPKDDFSKLLQKPGMKSVLVEGKRENCAATYNRIHVRPSDQVQWGVCVNINQHYQLNTDKQLDNQKRHCEAIRVLQEDWLSFVNFAREAAATILRFESLSTEEK